MLYGRRRSKPPLGVGIDWAHPLARGLQGFYTLNEGSGLAVNDATGNIPLSVSGYPAGTSGWTSGLTGSNAYRGADVAAGQITGIIPARLQVEWPISFAMAFTCLGAPANNNGRPFWTHDGDSNLTYFNWSIYWSTSMVPVAGLHLDASSYVIGAALVAGQHYTLGATVTNSEVRGFNGGSLYASYASAPAAPVYNTNPIIGFDGESGASANIKIDWACWYSRALSDEDHAELMANPWQLFEPPAYRLFPSSVPVIPQTYPALLLGMA